MANVIAVYANATHAVSTIQTELTTLNSANPITLVISGGTNAAEQGVSAWAQTNGIPWLALDPILDGAGFIYSNKPFGTDLIGPTANQVLLCGSSARITAASGYYSHLGTTITSIA